MKVPPFAVTKELDGWHLFWAHLELTGTPVPGRILLEGVAGEVRKSLKLDSLSRHPPVAAMRTLFKSAGTDPGRYRPASEALLRRVLKGDSLPSIHPLVDLNNCLSLLTGCPCCVMTDGSFQPPIHLRSGRPGEEYQSLKGPFRLEGRPLLLDTVGPLDTPITGSVRVKVEADTRSAWLVAYLPEGVVSFREAESALHRLVQQMAGVRASDISLS